MAILTDTTILREIENGNIVVEPFVAEHIGTNHTTTEPPLRTYAQKNDAKYQGQTDVTASRMHMNFDERLQELIGKSK